MAVPSRALQARWRSCSEAKESVMNETQVTVVGNVATPIGKRRLNDGTVVANFRVGSTERRYDRVAGQWVDGDRLYVDVSCWRQLAENTIASLVKGDPVVVTGRLYTHNYEYEGQRRSMMRLDAHSVAADLAYCTASVTRTKRVVAPAQAAGAEAGAGGDSAAGGADAEQTAGHDSTPPAPRLLAAVPAGEA
jgi:single-strand DNA-binding protein